MGEVGWLAECPKCDYATVLFAEDVTDVSDIHGEDEEILVSTRHCPECELPDWGDPTMDQTSRLEVIDDG